MKTPQVSFTGQGDRYLMQQLSGASSINQP